jgi:hypothetical protein
VTQIKRQVGRRSRGSIVPIFLAAILVFGAVSDSRPGDFDAGKAAFRVRFKEEITPYLTTGVFVLPGEKLKIEIPPEDLSSECMLDAAAGRSVREAKNRWVWEAPCESGDALVVIRCPELGDSVVLNTFVMVPFDSLKGGCINGYRIGEYPSIPLSMLPVYTPPKGFIEVTEANVSTPVSPHFRLGQFICKQESIYPKYVVLRERLVLKLELILENINAAGYRYDTIHVMSGYRTPHYNKAIGNVKYSRHLWGGAADIFLDGDDDGMMDDLNNDGRIDYRDADVVYEIIDRMYGRPWYERFLGGLAKYRKTSSHGPFVHVDVRGVRARWGD